MAASVRERLRLRLLHWSFLVDAADVAWRARNRDQRRRRSHAGEARLRFRLAFSGRRSGGRRDLRRVRLRANSRRRRVLRSKGRRSCTGSSSTPKRRGATTWPLTSSGTSGSWASARRIGKSPKRAFSHAWRCRKERRGRLGRGSPRSSIPRRSPTAGDRRGPRARPLQFNPIALIPTHNFGQGRQSVNGWVTTAALDGRVDFWRSRA